MEEKTPEDFDEILIDFVEDVVNAYMGIPQSTDPVHQEYMKLAIELAKKSQPDDGGPYVGAVLVKEGKIIAEAYKVRESWGTKKQVYHVEDLHLCHAEEKAIEIAGHEANGATLYVTLEPCTTRNSKGRPRPSDTSCVELIKQAGIAQVVAGMIDIQNPEIEGKGMLALLESGINATLYNEGLRDELEYLVNLGNMRRDSKRKEYFVKRIEHIRKKFINTRAAILNKKVQDGKKRESNRLKRIIDDGMKEYEENIDGKK